MCVWIADGLHTRKQSDEDVVHGGIWQQIPKAITSQRLIPATPPPANKPKSVKMVLSLQLTRHVRPSSFTCRLTAPPAATSSGDFNQILHVHLHKTRKGMKKIYNHDTSVVTGVAHLKTRHRLRNRCHPFFWKSQYRCHIGAIPVPHHHPCNTSDTTHVTTATPITTPLQHLSRPPPHPKEPHLPSPPHSTITHRNSPLTIDLLLHKTKQPKRHRCCSILKWAVEKNLESFRNLGRRSMVEDEYWQTKYCVGK